jgi:hypothetical protein
VREARQGPDAFDQRGASNNSRIFPARTSGVNGCLGIELLNGRNYGVGHCTGLQDRADPLTAVTVGLCHTSVLLLRRAYPGDPSVATGSSA